jgi:hypothetical protein
MVEQTIGLLLVQLVLLLLHLQQEVLELKLFYLNRLVQVLQIMVLVLKIALYGLVFLLLLNNSSGMAEQHLQQH